MAKVLEPFNLGMLKITEEHLKHLLPIKSLDILESSRQNFHPEGLWSDVIFGPVGDDRRSQRFAYIDVKLPVIHPELFKQLTSARALYKGIMSGEQYAIFNREKHDFEASNPIDGQTGMHFFISHFKDIHIAETNSISRKQLIRLFEKYKDVALNRYILVMPAGIRDVEFKDGTMEVDEVNTFYRKILSLSNNIQDSTMERFPELADATRYNIQLTFVQLYEHLLNIIGGKKGLILGSWASRSIMNGGRNVINAVQPGGRYYSDPTRMKHNQSAVGLFQIMKSLLPVATKLIKETFLSSIFIDPNYEVNLVDPDTLQSVPCVVDSYYFNRYQSDEGIAKIIQDFHEESIRHNPVIIHDFENQKDMYLALIYKGPDKTFRIMRDIRELPNDSRFSREDVHPITLGELLYLSVYRDIENYPATMTRYPVAGVGSIPATLPFLRTTITQETYQALDDDWTISNDIPLAKSFPVKGDTWFNAFGPSPATLSGLKADFDGDTMSLNFVYMDESRKEIYDFFNSFKPYIDNRGKWTRSQDLDTVKFATTNLSDTSHIQHLNEQLGVKL